jgi:hypothetical protein
MPKRHVVVLIACMGLTDCQPGSSATLARPAKSLGAPLERESTLEVATSPPAEAQPRPASSPCATDTTPARVALPERVTMGEFWRALSQQIALLDSGALQSGFKAFAAQHHVDASSAELFHDFTKLWVVFEATRDGGWWRLRWDITDQEPSSVKIWKAWFRTPPPEQSFAAASAVAECDEITALFSVAARRLGVRGVGLFYPTWNHVIAGWSPPAFAAQNVKDVVLIPTTQIYQACPATFDRTTFKPPRQVYEFPRVDIKDDVEMPVALATFLLEQVRGYAEASPALLALIRAKRAELVQSSLGDCSTYRSELSAELRPKLSCADRRALRHLATRELGRPELSDDETLSFLGSP